MKSPGRRMQVFRSPKAATPSGEVHRRALLIRCRENRRLIELSNRSRDRIFVWIFQENFLDRLDIVSG